MLIKPCISPLIPIISPRKLYNKSEPIRGGDDHDCLQKRWLRASIAGGITSLLTLLLYLSGQPHQVNKSTFLTGLIVAIILATAPIYDDNRLSLKQQSLLHFSIMCVTILPILCLSGWYPLHNVVDFLKILASFLTCGLVLWTLAYLIFGKLLNK